MNAAFPTRQDVVSKLQDLCEGRITREATSQWATSFVTDEAVIITDWAVWEVLKKLVGADVIATDRPYFFDACDFEAWAMDLTAKD